MAPGSDYDMEMYGPDGDEYQPDLEAAPEGEEYEADEYVDSYADDESEEEEYPYLDSLEAEEPEELPELVQRMDPEEKLEMIAECLDKYEHQFQLPSGMLNMFEEIRDILGN